MNQLEQLKKLSTIVADTGDIASIQRLKPVDATTNPSLILKAANQAEYAHIIDAGIKEAQKFPTEQARLQAAIEAIGVGFGTEILKSIDGVVSTEVDARASFDTKATIEQARRLIQRYQQQGIGRERVLVKIASTWEGIKAAELLEQEGIAYFFENETIVGIDPFTTIAYGGIKLKVHPNDEATVKEILKKLNEDNHLKIV